MGISISAVVLAILGGSAATGLLGLDANRSGDATTFRVHSDLVLVPVTVTDSKGRPVSGLNKANFTVYQDKIEQDITHFAREDIPASIGIIFDCSGSMWPKFNAARDALASLVNNSNRADEFFLITINSQPKLSVPLTVQKEQIQNALATLMIGGSTPLLDAVSLGMDEMRNARYNRKALIIISDGQENDSRCSLTGLKEKISKEDVLTYAIGPASIKWPLAKIGAALLSDITSETGGRLFEAYRPEEFRHSAASISSLIRRQYVLGYNPGSSLSSRKYHRIEVRLTKSGRPPKLSAVWRLGYYAPTE